MRTHFDRLIDGAAGAGEKASRTMAGVGGPLLCLVVSCYGRQMVLGQRTIEEVEAAHEHLPPSTVTLGFYSSGRNLSDVGGRLVPQPDHDADPAGGGPAMTSSLSMQDSQVLPILPDRGQGQALGTPLARVSTCIHT